MGAGAQQEPGELAMGAGAQRESGELAVGADPQWEPGELYWSLYYGQDSTQGSSD